MKIKLFIVLMAMIAVISGCADKKVSNDIKKIVNDTAAETGDLNVAEFAQYFSEEYLSLDSIVSDIDAAKAEFKEQYFDMTDEQVDEIFKFYTEYSKYSIAMTAMLSGNAKGEYVGNKNDDGSFNASVFVFKFDKILDELKSVDFDFLNKFLNESEFIEEQEGIQDDRVCYFISSNNLIAISGSYNDFESEIKAYFDK